MEAKNTRTLNALKQFLKVGLVASVFLGAKIHAQQPEQLLRDADVALQKEDYAGAVQALEIYLTGNPEDYRAEFNLAYAYSLLGRRSDAIRRYQSVLSREKELPQAHLNLGLLLLEEGSAAEAVEHLRVVVKQQPNNTKASFHLAQALSALHRTTEAQELYERLLSLQPDHAPTHLAYGNLLTETNPEAAEKHLRRVIELDSSSEESRLLLAKVLEVRAAKGADTLEEAVSLYRQYLATNPQRNDIRARLGQIYAQQGRFADAIEQWEKARADGDTSAVLAQDLLQVYLQEGVNDKERALLLVQEILVQDGNNAEMWLLAGQLWMEKKRYQEAAQQFRRVVELKPEWVQGYTNLASALYLLKDYEGTVAALVKISELQQDTAGTYFLRAISLDQLHRREQALNNYQRFLETDGGQNPDQEFQARQRIKVLTSELRKGYR